jgi:prepilin-type N-terminal cleavage/methylation domain-containing protein
MKPIQSNFPSPRLDKRHPQGFTLTEVLVTISIIAVLAVISFSAASRLISSANKAVCVQNLHGIGTAIQTYASEHNGFLPGPLYGGQTAEVTAAKATQDDPQLKGGSLVNFLARYMEGDRAVPTSGKYLLSNFGCPSLMKRVDPTKKTSPVVYIMTLYVMDVTGGNKTPWGYPGYVGTAPINISRIHPVYGGRTPAMVELDQTTGVNNWENNGAATPAHGNERMALYLDWSVRGQKLADWGKEPK